MKIATNVELQQALIIKHAISFYAKTGMKVNTAYTPKNMLAAATRITGQKFKPRGYAAAVEALEAWLKVQQDGREHGKQSVQTPQV